MSLEDVINRQIQSDPHVDSNMISDGDHTFGELYEHRRVLFIALCKLAHRSLDKYQYPVWRTRFHSDGSSHEGWFVLGIGEKRGDQITYHLPIKYWENCWFAREIEKAPEFDGHTAKDVALRLLYL